MSCFVAYDTDAMSPVFEALVNVSLRCELIESIIECTTADTDGSGYCLKAAAAH